MKRILITLWMIAACAAFAGENGIKEGQEGHGDVVFQTDDALRVFDALEYPHESFIPGQLPEYTQFVKPALQTLKTKLPKLAEKMEAMFERGINPRWYFVSYTLRDAHDEGQTHLMLTYKREQIALNDDGIIQIQKKLWDKLAPFDRAILLVHEVIWSTAEDGGIQPNSGDAVRKLSTLIVDKNLATFDADQVSVEVSRRAKAICQNLDACSLSTLSRISFLNRPVAGWEDISTAVDDKTPGSCAPGKHCVFSDEKTDLYWTLPLAGALSESLGGSWDDAREACASLGHFGGVEGWRLPSVMELAEAAHNGIADALEVQPTWRDSFNVFWSNTVSPNNENFAMVFDFASNAPIRHRRTGNVPWICVADDFHKNWSDVSVSQGWQATTCSRNTDRCAFLDHRTGLVWSERTPNHLEDEVEKADFALTWPLASHACEQMGEWQGGVGTWRLPSSKEFEAAYRHGFYRVAMANSAGFGRANDTFWLQDWEEVDSKLTVAPLRNGSLLFFDFFDGQVKREAFAAVGGAAKEAPVPLTASTARPWVCVRNAR